MFEFGEERVEEMGEVRPLPGAAKKEGKEKEREEKREVMTPCFFLFWEFSSQA